MCCHYILNPPPLVGTKYSFHFNHVRKLGKKQSILLRSVVEKLQHMIMFQYSIYDIHFGILRNELIYGFSVRFFLKE